MQLYSAFEVSLTGDSGSWQVEEKGSVGFPALQEAKLRLKSIAAALLLTGILCIFTGCYTRFADFTPDNMPRTTAGRVADSTGFIADTVATIDASSQETCVWERDLMGYPYLHCYTGSYPRSWYRHNFTPWWYQANAHDFNPDRCPSYYYYDPNCGCCRYYLNNPEIVSRMVGRHPDQDLGGGTSQPVNQNNNVSVTTSGSSHYEYHINPTNPTYFSPSSGVPASGSGNTISNGKPDSTGTSHSNDSSAVDTGSGAKQDTAPPQAPSKQPHRSMRGR